MILEGAGVCPFVKVGDIAEGREVVDIVCDRHAVTSCRAYKALALLRLKDSGEQQHFIEPWKVVGCDRCPVLVNDPNYASKTKSYRELIEAAIMRGDPLTSEHPHVEPVPAEYEEPKDKKYEHRNRFELIDISEEEQPDGESSSNPNQQ